MSLSEERRLAWRIFDLEHELEIGGHNDGYSCLKCWQLEDEGIDPLKREYGMDRR